MFVTTLTPKVIIVNPLPVSVHRFDVVPDGLFVFKHLVTGWAVILNTNVYISHVSLDDIAQLDGLSANHADESSGTFPHLGLHQELHGGSDIYKRRKPA
jgi:hypothetical protein